MAIYYFLIPILCGLIAQGLKYFFNKRFYSELRIAGQRIPRYGGMPSAHTAFAFSLATVVAWADGLNSATFAMAVAATIFILDDALRMRMFLSRHGLALHKLIQRLPEEEQKDFPYLETRLGHKVPEVIVGGALGILLALLFLWLFA
jgi:acid phosphatase family membrane protein YuiD